MYLAAGKKYQVKANTKGCGKTGAGHAKSIINVKAGKKTNQPGLQGDERIGSRENGCR
jgi:hypothetical protein